MYSLPRRQFSFRPTCAACGISAPQAGVELPLPAVEARSLNNWTPREVPQNLPLSPAKTRESVDMTPTPATSHAVGLPTLVDTAGVPTSGCDGHPTFGVMASPLVGYHVCDNSWTHTDTSLSPEYTVYIRLLSWSVPFMRLDKCVATRVLHFCVVQSSFTALKSCVLPHLTHHPPSW